MVWLIYLLFYDAGLGMRIQQLNIYANFTVIDVLIIVFLVTDLLIKKRTIKVNGLHYKLFVALFLFGFWQLVSVFFAQGNMMSGLGPVIRTLYYSIIILMLGIKIDSVNSFRKLVWAFMLGCITNYLFVIYLWNLDPRYYSGVMILNNTFLNRNTVYYFAVFALPFSFYLHSVEKGRFKKLALKLSMLLFTLIAFFTLSKGAWFLVVLIYAAFLLLNLKSFKAKRIIGILVLGITVLGVADYLGAYDAFTTLQFTNYSARDDVRIVYKIEAIQTGLENIVTGVGAHNYREYSIQQGRYGTGDPHDANLMIFAENGIVGLMLYLYMHFLLLRIYILTKNLVRAEEKNLMILVYFAYWTLSFLTGIVFTSKLFLVLILTFVSLYNTEKLKSVSFAK